ncbi:adenylate/guanylate cyclase domain-containing protein [Agrobacterium tumefaciens]|nr:adenylate/guanylate cyclase domain-containing protein [Agrobacterium tumefaciens]
MFEGFTSISERKAPEKVLGMLNELFEAVTGIVSSNSGLVISHVGDAMLISFNAPLPIDRPERRAVSCAGEILRLVKERTFDGENLRVRIGIASGQVAAGTVGSFDRQSYTLYGDAVNTAQRLEALNKALGTRRLLDEETFLKLAEERDATISVGSHFVPGRGAAISVYSI